jgi:hypothetical protein
MPKLFLHGPLNGISSSNQARIEWAIRLKYSPMPSLDMEVLSGQLNAFRIGNFRQIGKTWEVMMERDGELAVNSDKRKSDAAFHPRFSPSTSKLNVERCMLNALVDFNFAKIRAIRV